MNTIDDVIFELDKIIAWAEANHSAAGFFASLYRRMTIAVKVGIANSQFEDGARMEKLDIVFAKRYFDAFENWQNNKPIPLAWKAAYDAVKVDNITVIQHLLLGINAHINLDLGIAASEISSPETLANLENDFKKINLIIADLIDDTKLRLSRIWLPFRIFTQLLDSESDGIVNFSIKVARTFSWESTKQLTYSKPIHKNDLIGKIDKNVTLIAKKILNPSLFTRSILTIMKLGELGTMSDKIKILK